MPGEILIVPTSSPPAGPRRPGRPRIFTAAVLRTIPKWVADGATRRDIARALGTTVGSLEVICSQNGIPLRGSGGGELLARLGRKRWTVLRREAAARKITTLQLAVRLLAAVVDGNLFNAVLDDQDEDGA